MPDFTFHKGSTAQLIEVFLQDASRTDGGGLTGLTWASAGLKVSYRRRGSAGGMVSITLGAGTRGTWNSGSFVEIDSVNAPGRYELSLPNAVLASGANAAHLTIVGAVNLVQKEIDIDLDGLDSVQLGAKGLDGMLPDLANDATARASGLGMLRWLFNRFANQHTQNATEQQVYNDAGSVLSTLATTSDGTTVTIGKSS